MIAINPPWFITSGLSSAATEWRTTQALQENREFHGVCSSPLLYDYESDFIYENLFANTKQIVKTNAIIISEYPDL